MGKKKKRNQSSNEFLDSPEEIDFEDERSVGDYDVPRDVQDAYQENCANFSEPEWLDRAD